MENTNHASHYNTAEEHVVLLVGNLPTQGRAGVRLTLNRSCFFSGKITINAAAPFRVRPCGGSVAVWEKCKKTSCPLCLEEAMGRGSLVNICHFFDFLLWRKPIFLKI